MGIAGFFAFDIKERVEEFRKIPLMLDYIPLSNYYKLSQSDNNDKRTHL